MRRLATGLLAALLLAAGCDGGAAERRSIYESLARPWTVAQLTVDGFTFTDALEERYERLVLTFRTADDGTRRFRLRGTAPDGESLLNRTGRVALRGTAADGRQVLVMTTGFEEPVTWLFERPSAGRTTLDAPNQPLDGSRAFLRALLPSETWRANQPVSLELQAAD